MVQVRFYPDNKAVTVEEGTTILQAARKIGVVIESPCNGVGTCGKCKVKLDEISINNIVSVGTHQLSKEEAAEGYVLACEARIMGDIKVEVLSSQQNNTLKILSDGQSFAIEIDPLIKKEYLKEQNITRIFAEEKELSIEPGDTTQRNYGIVVDIGTTTLVASLIDLNNGAEIASASSLNPQAIHAQDVLSRIKLASKENGLEILYSELMREINAMIHEVTRGAGIDRENIYEIVFSGNTCMLHLASNTNPESLGRFPYTPRIKGAEYFHASEHQINISKFGLVYLPPIISAYVGADITSGILASQLHKQKGIILFVDIGTNGEMVIGLEGKLLATSTAAGPAFEGMNITYGMRAGEGAIEFFEVDEGGCVEFKVIGGGKATGICGSGLLDIIGELVANGVINKNGKFVDPETKELPAPLKERLIKQDGKLVFKITEEIVLSQKDVRQVQLAKGAVRAGIEFLLRNKGIKACDVDKVLIAGSFGYHLRAKSLINIGLLPKEFEGKIDFIGNTSKSGGQAFLLNRHYRRQMEKVVNQVEVLELANYKDFEKVFVQSLMF